MCGIFCSLSRTGHVSVDVAVQNSLCKRGPDYMGTVTHFHDPPMKAEFEQDGPSNHIYLTLMSTVLSLRGSRTTNQPYQDHKRTSTLCWNGEAWAIDGVPASGNDTQAVFELLQKPSQDSVSKASNEKAASTNAAALAGRLAAVAGPYALVFYDSDAGKVYFGRDFLGRRSLLRRITPDGTLVLSSVSTGDPTHRWEEVEADGLYCIDLNGNETGTNSNATEGWGTFDVSRVPYCFSDPLHYTQSNSVIPHLLLNKSIDSAPSSIIDQQSPSVIDLQKLLHNALTLRITKIPDPPASQTQESIMLSARLAILFSGGLDCTMLARLAHDILPLNEPIDLLNVAFENPRIHKTNSNAQNDTISPYELCPDRVTGRSSYAELSRICPGRQWRFIAIDIPYSETLKHRQNVVRLMHPHNTEMDLSIASALYFAARGKGRASVEPNNGGAEYTTAARVLLSGLGADELFAGYTRHATAFNRKAHQGLVDELDLDIGRLGKRNLGRDDRVISNWGREARFPFLDEKLVAWALAVPVSDKCGFGEPTHDKQHASLEGSANLEPGKKVLRCLAWRLGMVGVASERKRAIQFGARTAKMETGKTKGTTLLS